MQVINKTRFGDMITVGESLYVREVEPAGYIACPAMALLLCRDAMKAAVSRCLESDTVSACARMMREKNIGFVPVVDADEQVVGIVTDRDRALRVLAEERPGATPVSGVMTRDVRVCRPPREERFPPLAMMP